MLTSLVFVIAYIYFTESIHDTELGETEGRIVSTLREVWLAQHLYREQFGEWAPNVETLISSGVLDSLREESYAEYLLPYRAFSDVREDGWQVVATDPLHGFTALVDDSGILLCRRGTHVVLIRTLTRAVPLDR